MSWLKTLGAVAPAIASTLLGPLAGVAVKIATGELGIENTKQALEKAVMANDPGTLLKLKTANYKFELEAKRLDYDWKKAVMKDNQLEHQQTQETIRQGDTALDKAIRMVRPKMARQSWTATVWFCIGCFGVQALTGKDLFSVYIAGFLSTPAFAYLGLRTGDKFGKAYTAMKGMNNA